MRTTLPVRATTAQVTQAVSAAINGAVDMFRKDPSERVVIKHLHINVQVNHASGGGATIRVNSHGSEK